MGPRSTLTVGRAAATLAIETALKSGRLSNAALSGMIECVSDEVQYGAYNFAVTDEPGEDDQFWRPGQLKPL